MSPEFFVARWALVEASSEILMARSALAEASHELRITLAGGRVLGAEPSIEGTETRTQDAVLRPVVRVKNEAARDAHNLFGVEFRAGVRSPSPGSLPRRS